MILVFSNKTDIHCNPVLKRLRDLGEPFLRINTESLMTDYEFEFLVDRDDGPVLVIRGLGSGVTADSRLVKAVWDRRASSPDSLEGDGGPDALTGDLRRVALEECGEFARWIREFFASTHSIGSVARDRLAECKLLQMRVAWSIVGRDADASVRIPPSVVSNRRAGYERLASTSGRLAIKPISADGVTAEDGGEYPFLTRTIDADLLRDLPDETFSIAPSIAQPYLEKAYESRITMVSGESFCCRIDAQHLSDDRGRIDWRAGYGAGLRHSVYGPPPGVLDFCRRYLGELGLEFGCFDFVVDPAGVHWFLECNPNGQWMWIEEETGLPIADAIARSLVRGGSARSGTIA